MDVREKIMFGTGGGRQIEDRAKEGRIKYINRGLGMVNFYMEMEGGGMKEKNFSDYPADFIPCHEIFHAIQDILFYLLVYENVQLNQFFFLIHVINIVLM